MKFRQQLLEQTQPLGAERRRHVRDTGDIAFRPRKVDDEAGSDRIADAERHDRGKPGRLGRDGRRIAKDHDDIDLGCLQFLHQMRKPDGLPSRPTRSLEGQILSSRITKLRKSAEQKLRVRGGFRQESAGADEREAIDLARRLRDGHTGRYYHGAEQGDEITPFHERLRNDHTVRIDPSRLLHWKARNRTRRKYIRKIRNVRNGSKMVLTAPK